MTDSEIKTGVGGTAFVGPDAVRLFSATAIASGLRLYAKTGMRPNRAWSPSAMLAAAGKITGKRYKRGQYEQAAADVKLWADEMSAAIPRCDAPSFDDPTAHQRERERRSREGY